MATPAHVMDKSGRIMPDIVHKNASSGCLSRAERHSHIRGGRGLLRRRNSEGLLPGLKITPEKPSQTQNFLLAPPGFQRAASESTVKMRELAPVQWEPAPAPEAADGERWAQSVLMSPEKPSSVEKTLSRRAKACLREPFTPRGELRSAGAAPRPSPLKLVDAIESTPPRLSAALERSPPSPGPENPGLKSPASRNSSGGPGFFRFLNLPLDKQRGGGEDFTVQGKHVNFCPTPMNSIHPITPYSQIYGKHPQFFDYNRKGEMELTDAGIAAELAIGNRSEASN